ncbi:MAG: hypothetical protein AB4041_03570 [Microcystaceae cyanobacterium]
MFRDRENLVRRAGKRLILGKNPIRTVIKNLFDDLSSIENNNNSAKNQPKTEKQTVKKTESYYRDKLARQLNGKTEVTTVAGRIDILTSTEIIEVKYINRWKAAIGQIITYGKYYPNHQKRIHLFGVDNNNQSKLTLIKQHCLEQNINLTWENL